MGTQPRPVSHQDRRRPGNLILILDRLLQTWLPAKPRVDRRREPGLEALAKAKLDYDVLALIPGQI